MLILLSDIFVSCNIVTAVLEIIQTLIDQISQALGEWHVSNFTKCGLHE